MLARFTGFRPRLTVFVTTSYWLAMDAAGEGFEVSTWLDTERQRRWAKVVVGPSGLEKKFFGPVGAYQYYTLHDEWDALDWARQSCYSS